MLTPDPLQGCPMVWGVLGVLGVELPQGVWVQFGDPGGPLLDV